ncbi:TerC family protein [Crossiella sp. CA198]|uniref:TerC family protein n=1 Tax=Crossiella sp. CA198 TaxID=3455607 RepID=UPI003F8D428E
MTFSMWVWIATVGGLGAIVAFDFYLAARNPRDPSFSECVGWTVAYVTLAVLFGLGVLWLAGPRYGGEFFAGWITEYSLSVDNLFVFMLIMSRFAVPKLYRQKVLLVGIVIALLMRAVFIAVGAEAVSRFNWLFYVFGAFLIFTAWKLLRQDPNAEEEFAENVVLRTVKKFAPTTEDYVGAKMVTRIDGRRMVTPMLIVMVAIGTTDLLFALDSIPAIFGLTKEPYLVFTANAFALMGLRQLFFLIGGLLDRLVYLSVGLAVILAFIGVKLVLEAMHGSGVPWAPTISIQLSLSFIVGTLAVTIIASVIKSKRTERAAAAAAAPEPVRTAQASSSTAALDETGTG